MSLISDGINEIVSRLARKKANQIDDIIAGLLINGVTKDEIEIREYPGNITRIAVRGQEQYELKTSFSVRDMFFGKPEKEG